MATRAIQTMKGAAKSLHEVDVGHMARAMKRLAAVLTWTSGRKLEAPPKADCTFYIELDPLFFGIYGHIWRELKVALVGTHVRRNKAGEIITEKRPCLWGDPDHKAPSIIETESLSARGTKSIFCVRLPVDRAVVSGAVQPEFDITAEAAFEVFQSYRGKLEELHVRVRCCSFVLYISHSLWFAELGGRAGPEPPAGREERP